MASKSVIWQVGMHGRLYMSIVDGDILKQMKADAQLKLNTFMRMVSDKPLAPEHEGLSFLDLKVLYPPPEV